MARFFLPAEAWGDGQQLSLSGEEARHCIQVLRHEVGDKIQILDGRGGWVSAEIVGHDKRQVLAKTLQKHFTEAPRPAVTLYQAIPKGDGMDWIVQKAVELGVRRIVPLLTQRTIVRLKPADAIKKQQKWQRLALEACKQCGQHWLPSVAEPQALRQAVEDVESDNEKMVAALVPQAVELQRLLKCAPAAASVAIGPEGDFSPDEYELLFASGWRPICLGQLTLRCETAAIVTLSKLQHQCAILAEGFAQQRKLCE